MSKKDKPLPIPQKTPFGRKRHFDQDEEKDPLMADKMSMAMAEGKLDEFMDKELPDNEYARKLAEMMMGMTGMLPSEGPGSRQDSDKGRTSDKDKPPVQEDVPEDIVQVAESGDVENLMQLLAREHQKRMQGSDAEPAEKERPSTPQSGPVIEKEVLDQLIKIASDNNISPDWIMLRALKLYIEEYQKTKRL